MSAPQPAAVYTHGHQEAVLRSHRSRTAADSAAYLLPELRPGQAVLDIGCGPGTITADLAELVGPEGRVVAVDTSAEVLERAAEYVAGRGPAAEVVFEQADVHRLPYRDGEFDVVHAHQVLQHVADPVAALREMRRVTAPGGVVAARDVDYASMTWFPDKRQVLGPRGRLRRGHRERHHLDVRDARAARLVGRDVGGPGHRHHAGPDGGRAGLRGAGRAGADRGRLAGVERRGGRLVLDAARRDPGPRLSWRARGRAGGRGPGRGGQAFGKIG